jgi:hypothetical protein
LRDVRHTPGPAVFLVIDRLATDRVENLSVVPGRTVVVGREFEL